MIRFHLPYFMMSLLAASQAIHAAEPTVQQESRAFRLEIYQKFRTDRARYDQLRELDSRLNQRWRESAKTADKSAKVVDWYGDVRLAMAENKPLPAMPDLPRQELVIEEEKSILSSLTNSLPSFSGSTPVANPTASRPASAVPAAPAQRSQLQGARVTSTEGKPSTRNVSNTVAVDAPVDAPADVVVNVPAAAEKPAPEGETAAATTSEGSHGIGQALGRALWKASVDTMLGK